MGVERDRTRQGRWAGRDRGVTGGDGHNHDDRYAPLDHEHESGPGDGLTQEEADLLYAAIGHDHDGIYDPAGSAAAAQAAAIAASAPVSHNHDAAYSPLGHNHAGVYVPVASVPWTALFSAGASRVSNSLAADSALTITLAAGYYTIRGALVMYSNATPDFKYQFVCSAGITHLALKETWHTMTTLTGTDAENYAFTYGTAFPSARSVTSTVTGMCIVEFLMILNTSGAGTLEFHFAQNNTDAGNATTMRPGSYVEYYKAA